jgi:hypothetical protein
MVPRKQKYNIITKNIKTDSAAKKLDLPPQIATGDLPFCGATPAILKLDHGPGC